MAYRSSRKKKQSSPLKRQLFFGGSTLILLGVCMYGVWWGTAQDAVHIHEVEVSGGSTVSHDRIKEAVWNTLRGRHYLLVDRSFQYLYPEVAVREAVESVPRVHDVSVVRDGDKLQVSFGEYEPYALWCDTSDDETCVFLTKEGFGFDEAPRLTGGVFVRYITETASSTSNTQALSATEMLRGSTFIYALQQEFGFDVTSVTYTADGDEVYLLARGSRILRTGEDPIDDSLEKLRTIFGSEQFVHLITTPFEYIDVRFGNRVFVKEIETLPREE